MVYNRDLSPTVIHTWIQLRGLAWGRDETPQLSMLELSELIGKSRSTLYGHMALLRSWGALRWRPSEAGIFIVTFPADTGEFYLVGDSLPDQVESEILDTPVPPLAGSPNPQEGVKVESEFLDTPVPPIVGSPNSQEVVKGESRNPESRNLEKGDPLSLFPN